MRKPVFVSLIAVIAVLLAATGVLFTKVQKTTADYAEVKSAEETARNQYAEAFNAIAEIQDSLDVITVRDQTVKLTPEGLQSERRLSQPNRAEALESIALLNASIQRTKEKINSLEENLRKNGTKVKGLNRMIANLKNDVTEKEDQIALLTGRVDSLTTTVAVLETTVQAKDSTIYVREQTLEEKRVEAGTIFYVAGTRKELENSGVVESKGGVLGVGKTLALSAKLNDSVFTSLDTDQQTVIRIPATVNARVQVVSPQTKGSYEVKLEGDEVVIHILDPVEFRKVKHLVVVTA